jgi:hypothetical protein
VIDAVAPALGRSIDWPSPPAMYSYSSIADIGWCPRRWALRSANYPDVWDGYGYPPRPGYGTIRGLALHRAMELLADAAAGISDSVHDLREPAIRCCGGYTELLRRALADVWKSLQRNPRITPYLDQWQLRVEQDIGEFRHLLQKLVAQTPLPASPPVTGPLVTSRGRHTLPNGVYQEIAVQSQALRLKGKIDLLIISEDCDIVIDFKTGEPDPGHKTQLELYALLWSQDERNGKQTAPELRIVYPGHEMNWDPPDLATLQAAASSVAAAVAENDELLTATPPPA